MGGGRALDRGPRAGTPDAARTPVVRHLTSAGSVAGCPRVPRTSTCGAGLRPAASSCWCSPASRSGWARSPATGSRRRPPATPTGNPSRNRPSCRAADAASCPSTASSRSTARRSRDELGALGIGTPDDAARKLARQARAYDRARRPGAARARADHVIANADAGEDGHVPLAPARRGDPALPARGAAPQDAAACSTSSPAARTSSPRRRGWSAGCASPTSASRSTPSGA